MGRGCAGSQPPRRSRGSLCRRVFYGMTTEETILREIALFWELLGSTDAVLQETYIVAVYENPSVPQRRNEIWFIRRAE